MAETYSLAVTGLRAGDEYTAKTVQVGDSVARSYGGPQLAMQLNTQVLCKNPDGSQSWYTFDAERSTPSNLIMKRV